MSEIIKIDLGFAKLVIDKGDPLFREVVIGLESPSGDWQDIAVVNQTTTTRHGEMAYDDSVSVYVYADEQQEDFTDKFIIGLYDGYK